MGHERRRRRARPGVGRCAGRRERNREGGDPDDHDAGRQPVATPATARGPWRCGCSLVGPACPIPKHEAAPFGDPADSVSPVALRPRLATGVLFRGGRSDQRGRPCVQLRRIRRLRSAILWGYRHFVLAPPARSVPPGVVAVPATHPDLPAGMPSARSRVDQRGLGCPSRCHAAPPATRSPRSPRAPGAGFPGRDRPPRHVAAASVAGRAVVTCGDVARAMLETPDAARIPET